MEIAYVNYFLAILKGYHDGKGNTPSIIVCSLAEVIDYLFLF